MGTYVNLSILPNEISSQRWEEVFDESLQLLKAFPFANAEERVFHDYKLPVYVQAVESNEPTTHWKCNGDLESKRYGETFKLHKDISKYQISTTTTERREDILLEKDDQRMGHVFDSKTQGHPYHLHILAIAMLIESRFPHHALVGGDIDYQQCVEAQKWANDYLSKQIDIIVRVQPEALLSRMTSKNDKIAIDFLEKWLITDKEKLFEVIHTLFPGKSFLQWFSENLKSFNSPTQVGALKLLIYYLNSVKDIDNLAHIACKYEKGPKFLPSDFIKALAGTWISLPRKKFSFMKLFEKVEGHPVIVERQFGTVLLDMKFTGREIKTYMPMTELATKLSKLFPEIKESPQDILQKKMGIIEKDLEAFHNMLQPILEVTETDTEEKMYLADEDAFLYYDGKTVELTANQDFILQSIAFGVKVFLKKYSEIGKNVFNSSIDDMKRILVAALDDKFNMIVTEQALEWIRDCEDIRLIKVLLVKLMMDDFTNSHNDKQNYDMRKAMFENKELTIRIADYLNDETVMKKVEVFMQEKN